MLKLAVKGATTGRPTVVGETNLPDGTALTITVSSRVPNGPEGQASPTIQGKRFAAGPFFGPQGSLSVGNYTAEALVAIPEVQPPRVQAVIGPHGEHLKGTLVQRNNVSVTVETSLPFFVGESASKAELADRKRGKAYRAKFEADLRALEKLVASGRLHVVDAAGRVLELQLRLKGIARLSMLKSESPVAGTKRVREFGATLEKLESKVKRKVEKERAQAETERARAESLNKVRGPRPSRGFARIAVKSNLKDRMHDPDSLSDLGCSEPEGSGVYWITECAYRGKNALGGKIWTRERYYLQNPGGEIGEDNVVKVETIR
jgi:hypothetical protein